MKRYSKKGLELRKKQRKGFKDFYIKHIDIIKKGVVCKECGAKLKGHVSEVAHILPKSTFKSIATNDLNIIYLCGMYSESQCHTNFDTFSNEKFKKMLVYPFINDIFVKLEPEIQEKINYKIYDRYTD